jgi:hypothetical protein
MAATVIQAGSTLVLLSEAGVPTTLVLPTGVTLRTDIPPRWCQFNNYLVLVNTPSQPLIIDSTGKVRLLSPKAPRLASVLSAVAGGTLTGSYAGVRYTFVTLDENFNIISESDYSPASNTQAVTAQFLKAANLDLSPDEISLRRIYRPTSNGAVLFQWVDLNGNVQTSIQDDLADAALSLFGAPILGTPPRLTQIGEFRQRLWGVSDLDIDHVLFTEAGVQYAWPSDNLIAIPQIGTDRVGINSMISRREALGIGRRNILVQITGTGIEDQDGIADFDAVILSRELGVESQETVKVFRDTAYFLWKDGVYSWGSEGIKCVSDQGGVRSWFVTNSYFNRDKFTVAFAHIDPDHPHYRLFLCSAGSTTIDRWVEYDINDGTWWGPHKTGLFTPTSAFARLDANDKVIPLVGGPATVYQEQDTRTDGSSTAIEFDAVGKQHYDNDPDVEKYFGELTVLQKAHSTGTIQVTSRVGDLLSTVPVKPTRTIVQDCSQARPRTRLGRLGSGKHAQIEITNSEVGQDVDIYGYEIDPVNTVGKR